MNIEAKPALRKESMRIAGKLVATDESVEVRNPYNGKVIGTVPAGRPEHVRAAFAQGARLSGRSSRATSASAFFRRTAEILRDRKEEFARLITAESGLVLEGFALRSEPRLRRLVLRGAAHHQG